ncbi:hypothetical protein AYR59_00535 [Fructilactobacillus lindneri]|nr:hypothetical protein AYR60_00535 [Fructilactobacillus lindneri]ANZ58639.1 hypothetical protein AYR59_00535 [Fructilactobacillus lindneri]
MVAGASQVNPVFPVDGLKTGTTEKQEENLVATTNKDGKRIITVVLCTPRGQRFSQTTRLMEEVYNNHHTVKYDKKNFKKDVSVANGVDVVIPVKIKKSVYFWLNNNNRHVPVTKQVTIDKKLQNTDGSVMAPVKKNQKIGGLKLGMYKQKVAYVGKDTAVPVYTKKSDEKAGFFTNLFRDIL